VTVALCDALTYLHEHDIVHCDLNPGNVLFDSRDHPKLLDLGLAHVSDTFVHRPWQTQRGFAMGTIFYMAPEQLDGARDDPSVDLYALGAMLYQMLSGRFYLDFDLRGTPRAQAHNVGLAREVEPEPIPGVPSEVNAVVLRALAKRPGDRYPDVETFRQRLVQAMFAHLSPEPGLGLASWVPQDGVDRPLLREAEQWPGWVWGVLLAMNLAVMATVALLLFKFA
jgi:serine/threonine-protein kinase